MFSTEGSWTFTGAVALGFADNEEFYSLFSKKPNSNYHTSTKKDPKHFSCQLTPSSFSTVKNGSRMLCHYIQKQDNLKLNGCPLQCPQVQPHSACPEHAPPEGIPPQASTPSKERQERVSDALFFLQTIDMYSWELGVSSQWP